MNKGGLQFSNYQNHFVLITSDNDQTLTALGKVLFEKDLPFIKEVIATKKEICIKLRRPLIEDDMEIICSLHTLKEATVRHYILPVCFEMGKDWKLAEEALSFSKKEIITHIESQDLALAMFGFLPGFLYLEGLNKEYHIARKSNPSKYIEAGTVALGGKYLGVYTLNSPGGWYSIGKTPLQIFKKESPPIPLLPNDSLRIQRISHETFNHLMDQNIGLEEYQSLHHG